MTDPVNPSNDPLRLVDLTPRTPDVAYDPKQERQPGWIGSRPAEPSLGPVRSAERARFAVGGESRRPVLPAFGTFFLNMGPERDQLEYWNGEFWDVVADATGIPIPSGGDERLRLGNYVAAGLVPGVSIGGSNSSPSPRSNNTNPPTGQTDQPITQPNVFPPVVPCEECDNPGIPLQGPACPSDQTQIFSMSGTGSKIIMFEVAGVNVVPVSTVRVSAQPATGTYNPGNLTLAGSYFAALLFGGYVIGGPTDSDGPPNPPPNFGSGVLTIDLDQKFNFNPGDLNPEIVGGHRHLVLPPAGPYGITILSAAAVQWGGGGIALISNGQQPTIIQSVITQPPTGHVATLPAAPRSGNLLVAVVGTRVGGAGSCDPPTVAWSAIDRYDTLAPPGNSGRVMWKEVCT